MNIALIGYGRMGHEIEEIAIKRGHTIGVIIDENNSGDLNKDNLRGIDAAFVFSIPATAFDNISVCLSCKVPVVSGTTGWLDDYDRVTEICIKNGTSFIHSPNFSIGVNLFFRLNAELAKQMMKYPDYRVSVEEVHHVKKLDAPSGTAITLANEIADQHQGYSAWSKESSDAGKSVPVSSIREGDVPGIHTVKWGSDIDSITLRHEAQSRKGFALGAVVAAEYIFSRKGVFTMSDVMGF